MSVINQKLEGFYTQRKVFLEYTIYYVSWRHGNMDGSLICITNKIREVNVKMLHNIYLCKTKLSIFNDLDENYTLCKVESDTIIFELFSLFWVLEGHRKMCQG